MAKAYLSEVYLNKKTLDPDRCLFDYIIDRHRLYYIPLKTTIVSSYNHLVNAKIESMNKAMQAVNDKRDRRARTPSDLQVAGAQLFIRAVMAVKLPSSYPADGRKDAVKSAQTYLHDMEFNTDLCESNYPLSHVQKLYLMDIVFTMKETWLTNTNRLVMKKVRELQSTQQRRMRGAATAEETTNWNIGTASGTIVNTPEGHQEEATVVGSTASNFDTNHLSNVNTS